MPECPDWGRRIVAGESLIPGGPLYPGEAAEALRYFGELRIVDAPGQPRIADTARPWVTDFAGAIFGAYNVDTGRRDISEFFLLISKKNGKSTIAAGIMLTVLLRNWRQSAEYIILAPTIEVANNAYAPARDMVKADPELSVLLQVQDNIRTIKHRKTGATLKIVAANNEVVGGKKASGILIDELWLFGAQPNAENMLREATGGLASRPEGFVVYLSTQSDAPPAGIFKQKLDYARRVRDGKISDPKFLPIIYEFPPDIIAAGKHLEPENFHITNPNLGISVDEEFLTREYRKAVDAGEQSLRGYLAKHLNVEINLGLMGQVWAGTEHWEACGNPAVTLDALLARCEVVVAGVDGGGLDDLLGLTLIGRETGTGQWLMWSHAWAAPVVFARRKDIAARLRDFERDGDLSVCATGQDVREVADIIERVESVGLLDRIGVDAVGIGAIVDEIISRGIEDARIVAVPQGWKLVGAIKTMERKLAARELTHGGRPLMAWCVGNAKPEPRGNAVIITKQVAGSAKIDPLMAAFNAATLMALNPRPRKVSHQMLFI